MSTNHAHGSFGGFKVITRTCAIIVMVGFLLPLGCTTGAGNANDNDNANANVSDSTVGLPSSFDKSDVTIQRRSVSLDEANRFLISEQIESSSEVDIYELGPLSLGDRIEVLCVATGLGLLDPMIALFDADGFRVFWNDDINPATANFDAAFEGNIRHTSSAYLLAVTTTTFANTTGPYRLSVEIEPGVGVAPIIGQTVLLRFSSAPDVVVDDVERGNLAAFDAATVDPSFAGRTQDMKDAIVEIVGEDFSPYDLELLTTDDETTPEGNFTTLFFGDLSSQNIFGISDSVDFYNSSDLDNAIVFIGEFSGLSGNFDAIAQAIANVTSHEIGHTLGLMHTVDATTLMDTSGNDLTLLKDQSFSAADVADFPIGQQNAPLLLEETIGRVTAANKKYVAQDGVLRCGTCGATIAIVSGHQAN